MSTRLTSYSCPSLVFPHSPNGKRPFFIAHVPHQLHLSPVFFLQNLYFTLQQTQTLSQWHFMASWLNKLPAKTLQQSSWWQMMSLLVLIFARSFSMWTGWNMSKVWHSKLFILCNVTNAYSFIMTATNFRSDQDCCFGINYNKSRQQHCRYKINSLNGFLRVLGTEDLTQMNRGIQGIKSIKKVHHNGHSQMIETL